MWGVGTVMIIFLASLLDVPEQLYEAAELDGANAWQRLVHVTLPAISPVILFAVVTGVIDALQYFTQGYVAGTVAGGGDSGVGAGTSLGYPEGSTLFYPVWLFQQGFQYFNMGYASAMAVALFVIALAVTVVLLRSARHWVSGVEGTQ
jgi:multiple sugar transport system permease protein